MNNLIKSVFVNQRSEKKTRKGLKFYVLHMKVDMFAQNMCKLHLQGHCWNGPHISLLSFCLVSFISFSKIIGPFPMHKPVFDKTVNRNDVPVHELIFPVMLY